MLQPDMPMHILIWACCLQEFGLGEKAAGYYRRVLELQPGNAPAYHALGEVFAGRR